MKKANSSVTKMVDVLPCAIGVAGWLLVAGVLPAQALTLSFDRPSEPVSEPYTTPEEPNGCWMEARSHRWPVAGPLEDVQGVLAGSNAVCIRPGKIGRSPTGTGCSARMAVLHAQGRMQVGDRYRARSIIGSEFECGIDPASNLMNIGRNGICLNT